MIRVSEVRVIGADGEQLGVMPTDQALDLAGENSLDLVEVSPMARPPVCRIMDYGKYKYEQNKRQKLSKKKQHSYSIKEIKMRPKTEEHDYQFKKKHAEEFLEKHHKVKFTIVFRGRELSHKELGARILKRVREELTHVGTVEREPQFEGRLMIMVMAPLTGKSQPRKPKTAEPKAAVAKPAGGDAEDAKRAENDTISPSTPGTDTASEGPSSTEPTPTEALTTDQEITEETSADQSATDVTRTEKDMENA
jgi:translation initiation factor IF-3